MRVRASAVTIFALLSALSLVGLLVAPAVAQAAPESPFEVTNDPTEAFGDEAALLESKNATIARLADRLVVEIAMPTPIPGTYRYPTTVPPERYASPEAFTLWVFVFNHPDACVSSPEPPRCGPDDFTDAVMAGIYGVAGHVTSVDHSGGAFELDRGTGGIMTLRGEIMVGQAQRSDMPPESRTFPLIDPALAEVHLAVAPHGQIEPATISTELFEPAGSPACGCWWVAFFASPQAA